MVAENPSSGNDVPDRRRPLRREDGAFKLNLP